ncbi:hypothetical protein [Parachlamydia sp. AcF125]|uniref:hypothetical protein n=1 Tax=Parachlamydia sp. AcF125 TaxID=2795736 RepID=UPI001BCA4B18|nr:hypothetical protein [Parachlamydia sp. AcF125]MBS4169177.1 hypothetical protein [Parachlamydia sp. AcF125]
MALVATFEMNLRAKTFEIPLHPAMSFAQPIRIGPHYYLLTVELADTLVAIKKANGTFDTSLVASRPDRGLGIGTIKVHATLIGVGDTIIAFSNGIGEFLALEECKEIISRSPSSRLLENFKIKIIEKGRAFTERTGEAKSRLEKDLISANHRNLLNTTFLTRKAPHIAMILTCLS